MAIIDNLISYYKLDENAPNTDVNDAHGVNDGTASTNTSNLYDAAGKINSAFNFDGSTEYVTLGTAFNVPLSSHDFSVSFWIKPDTTLTGTNYRTFIWSADTEGWRSFWLNGYLYFSTLNAGEAWLGSIWNSDLTADTWYHVVLTYNETSKVQTLYVNGVSRDSDTRTTSMDAIDGNMKLAVTSTPLGQYFDGDIDEVAIWDKTLIGDEISALYNDGNGLAYPFVVGTNMKINISDVFKDIESLKINIGNVWKDVVQVLQNIGGVWKNVFG